MKIVFSPEAFKKFRAYIHGIDYEISGFGKVEKIGEDLKITDIKIFPQVVTEAHTEMDARSLAAFWDELLVAGEDIGQWKLWWHSHVNMQAQFSQTDYNTIEEFDSEMPEENWMLSIVTNKMGQSLARIDIFAPIRCTINNVPYDVEVGDNSLSTDVAKEIEDKVTIHTQRNKHQQEKISWGTKNVWPPRRSLVTEEEAKRFRKEFNLPPENEIIDITPVS